MHSLRIHCMGCLQKFLAGLPGFAKTTRPRPQLFWTWVAPCCETLAKSFVPCVDVFYPYVEWTSVRSTIAVVALPGFARCWLPPFGCKKGVWDWNSMVRASDNSKLSVSGIALSEFPACEPAPLCQVIIIGLGKFRHYSLKTRNMCGECDDTCGVRRSFPSAKKNFWVCVPRRANRDGQKFNSKSQPKPRQTHQCFLYFVFTPFKFSHAKPFPSHWAKIK